MSKKATLPSSPRTASVRPSALSASSRTRAPPAVEDGQRRGAAQQRRQEVAARRRGVVERHALAREEQRAVERGLDQRLGAEALRDRRGRLVRAPSRAPAARPRPRRSAATSSTSAAASSARRRRVARVDAVRLVVEELALEPVQAGVGAGRVGPFERRRQSRAAVELARLAPGRLPLRRRLR